MEYFIITVVSVIVIYLSRQYMGIGESETDEKFYSSNQEQRSEEANVMKTENDSDTVNLVYEVLRKIGCEPAEEKQIGDEYYVYFNYQGETFLIIAKSDTKWINVYDLWWYSLSSYKDIEEFSILRKLINEENKNGSYIVFYTINNENEQIDVHTKKNVLFIPQIPDIDQYLISVLQYFFETKRNIFIELEKHKVVKEHDRV
ncbi:MAG: hypothetical protein IJL45_08930 [Prevotella sp.]|nr:hypothetical protein [Prevotella sp.]